MLTKTQEFARGYKVLLAAILGSGTGVAVLVAYGLGAFVTTWQQDFGWTRTQIMVAPLIYAVGVLLAGAGAGALVDRWGARRVALSSQCLLAAGLAAMSRLGPRLWIFYAAYLVLPMLAAGTLPATWTRAVIAWFSASRGLALGLSLVATGMIGAALPGYLTWLIESAGWRTAHLGLAAIPLVIGLPAAIAFFREPIPPAAGSVVHAMQTDPGTRRVGAAEAAGSDYRLSEALRTRTFWQLSLSFVVAAICVSAVLTHAIPLLRDRGVAAPVAAALAGLFGLAVTGGRLLTGYLLDSHSGPLLAFAVFAAGAAACVLLVGCGDNRLLCGLSIVLVGVAAGGEADIGAYLTNRYFGRSHYGAIYGLFYALYCLGGGFGPLLAGLMHDHTESYRSALLAGAAGFAAAALLAATLKAPGTQRRADALIA